MAVTDQVETINSILVKLLDFNKKDWMLLFPIAPYDFH